MPNSDFIPSSDEGKAALFERFRDTIGSYATTLGLVPVEVADQADDATWFRYLLNHSIVMRDCGSQWTSFKNLILNGPGDGGIPATPATSAPPSPSPTSMPPGILPRFRELCRRIKAASPYTDAIGEALGIIGPEHTPQPQSTTAPQIKLRLNGGRVEVLWTKDGHEALEIQVDRGTGTFSLLAIDTRPDYIDTEPLPATAAKWSYRATYTQDAQRIGQWSNVAEITVGGVNPIRFHRSAQPSQHGDH
ncbi:MAG: hypothetical protein V4584_15610 [Verrucomicrobiota bacterium]